ncbi:MAG: hypothetical protein WBB55_05925 [Anaerolineales bacterium]
MRMMVNRSLLDKTALTTCTTVTWLAGFAQSAHVLPVLGFLPVIGPLVRFLGRILAFFGVWMGTDTAE